MRKKGHGRLILKVGIMSGNDFIMTGEGENRGEDIEMLGATDADYDFIAHAKQDIPKLIQEIRSLLQTK